MSAPMKIGLVATEIWGSIHLETARELSQFLHSVRDCSKNEVMAENLTAPEIVI